MKRISLSCKNLLTRLKKLHCPTNAWKRIRRSFFYLTGLCVEDFDCLFACVEPYISAIIYPNCKTKRLKRTIQNLYTMGCVSLKPVWSIRPESLPGRGSFSFTSGILCIWLPGHSVAGRLHRELDCFTRKLWHQQCNIQFIQKPWHWQNWNLDNTIWQSCHVHWHLCWVNFW